MQSWLTPNLLYLRPYLSRTNLEDLTTQPVMLETNSKLSKLKSNILLVLIYQIFAVDKI
jgi:hypothetical protein